MATKPPSIDTPPQAESQAEPQMEPVAVSVATATPSTEQLAESPTWGQGGRYVINPKGERVLAAPEE